MEIIKVTGPKQFLLEFFNFLVNLIVIVIFFMAENLLFFNIIEYTREKAIILNLVLLFFYLFILLGQNIFFTSFFYAITKYRIKSVSKKNILFHNFIFNAVFITSIVIQLFEVNFLIKIIFIILLLLEFVPCFMKKYSRSLSCYILKIETMKLQKKIENDGILL